MGPIDYTSQLNATPDPSAAFLQSFQGFAGVRQAGLQQQQQEAALAQQKQMQQDLIGLSQNPSPDAIAKMSVRYPQLSEQFKRSYDMLNTQQQEAKVASAIPVYAALQSGRPDIAVQKLRDTAAAMKTSGNQEEAARTLAWADMIEQHPENAKLTSGLLLSSVMGADKFAETFGKIGSEQRAQEQAPADLAKKQADASKASADATKSIVDATYAEPRARADLNNTLSIIKDRGERLKLDKDRLESEIGIRLQENQQKWGQLPDDARKIVNEATASAVAAEQSAGQMLGLASKLEALGGGNGGFSSAWEWLKKSTGWQGDLSAARQEYTRLRNSQAVKALPPGPSTDKDIELAMKGFPSETADSSYLASFLRGQAKLQQLESAAETARADWVGQVGSLTRPKKDIEVDGVKVAAGTSFPDFLRGYAKNKSDSIGKDAAVSSRSYMRFAAPSAPAAGGAQ